MIESLAYRFYLADGCPEGRAVQHWLEAEELSEAEAGLEPDIFAHLDLDPVPPQGLPASV